MSYFLLKALHIFSLFMSFLFLGSLLADDKSEKGVRRKVSLGLHGISLVLALMTGLTLLGKLEKLSSYSWFLSKILIWVLLGLSPLFLRVLTQKVKYGRVWFVLGLVLLTSLALFSVYTKF